MNEQTELLVAVGEQYETNGKRAIEYAEKIYGELVQMLTKKLAELHQLELEGKNMRSLIKETQEDLDQVLDLLLSINKKEE